ncbi:MAG: hypothetical protein U0R49_01710 [Fimbriimonadales bacterium]
MEPEQFGELKTDEPVSTWDKPPIRKDPDKAMMAGCLVVAWSSFAILISLAMPFVVSKPMTFSELYPLVWIGGLAALVLGTVITFLFRIPGFCGSVAGIGPAAVFIWIRLRELALGMPGVPDMPPAEYDASFAWLVPLVVGLCLVVVWFGVLSLRLRNEPPPS